MIPKKKVTEEDLKVTEAMLARSFTNLKSSMTRVPSDIVKPLTGTVREHPYATIAAAAGIGLVAYEFIKLVTPRVVMKEVKVQPRVDVSERGRSKLTSQVMALAAPYLVGYLQQEVSRLLSKPREE
jgi:hypothetical protein